MTAHALKGDRDRCLAAGMDDYVSKPVHAQRLFEVIAAQFEDSYQDPQPTPSPEPATKPPLPAACVDWAEVLEGLQGDEGMLAALLEVAYEEIPKMVAAIREAAEQHDPKALHLAAHKLRGSTRYFGQIKLEEQTLVIEAMANENRIDEVAEPLDRVDCECRCLLAAMSEFMANAEKNDL
jgi:CheY-like chemotaxis protein